MFVSLQTVLRVVNPPQAGDVSHQDTAPEMVMFLIRISLPAASAPGVQINGGAEPNTAVAKIIKTLIFE